MDHHPETRTSTRCWQKCVLLGLGEGPRLHVVRRGKRRAYPGAQFVEGGSGLLHRCWRGHTNVERRRLGKEVRKKYSSPYGGCTTPGIIIQSAALQPEIPKVHIIVLLPEDLQGGARHMREQTSMSGRSR
ncbi:hypothetical protein BKA93DRAFT_505125 [Sparassis latifolia]